MTADYDSWRDDPAPTHGVGWDGNPYHKVRVPGQWRRDVAHRTRLALVDLGMLLIPVPFIILAIFVRSPVTFCIAVLPVVWTGLWFRTQRMHHERPRPR